MLGLPDGVTACLFDLDGVLTDTAAVHSAAWKQAFDEFLEHGEGAGDRRPFREPEDYDEFVDGKPREDGVRDFLAGRGLGLPEGAADDPPGYGTVHALGNLKNRYLQRRIERDGVHVYDGSRRYLQRARASGLRRAVVSSSANTRRVLAITGLDRFVEQVVDGATLAEKHLDGKPAPDAFLEGARALGVDPRDAAVFEDALAGVQAGHAGGFGCVIGVNRLDAEHGRQLREHGADRVVTDLAELIG